MMVTNTTEQAVGLGIGLPIAISALLAGADVPGLVLGLITATLATFFLGSVNNRWKAGAGVLLAALLAGFAAPVIAAGILHQWPEWRPVMDLAHPLMSILIGGSAPTILPALLTGLARRADRLGGGDK